MYHHFLSPYKFEFLLFDQQGLLNGGKRYCIEMIGYPGHKGLDNGQGYRKGQDHLCALAVFGFKIDHSTDSCDIILHHIHPYSPTRDLIGLFLGSKSRQKDQIQDFFLRQVCPLLY